MHEPLRLRSFLGRVGEEAALPGACIPSGPREVGIHLRLGPWVPLEKPPDLPRRRRFLLALSLRLTPGPSALCYSVCTAVSSGVFVVNGLCR